MSNKCVHTLVFGVFHLYGVEWNGDFLLYIRLDYIVGRSENHKNALGICPECYYYVLVYYKTGFEEKN